MSTCMTIEEIEAKIEQYKLSDAPIEVKEAAIKALEKELSLKSSKVTALDQFFEGQADINDIN